MSRSALVYLATALFLLSLLFISLVHLTHLSDLELIRINTRRSYFPPFLGKIYENKFTQSFEFSRNVVFHE